MHHLTRILSIFLMLALFTVAVPGCARRGVILTEGGEPYIPPSGKATAEIATPVSAPHAVKSVAGELPTGVRAEVPAAQPQNQPRSLHSEDCRSCHVKNVVAGVKDFNAIFAEPKSHHPVGVSYPAESNPNFSQPNGRQADVLFFDRNGNGLPDSDEIVLFVQDGTATVECATCHQEHSGLPQDDKHNARSYLRVANTASALCVTCHRQ